MPKGIIGRKVGMTQLFDEDGNVIPATVIQAGPCVVVRKKSAKGKDGYSALVLGFEDMRSSEVDGEVQYKGNKPSIGVYEKAGVQPKKVLKEIRIWESELDDYEIGQELGATLFNSGELVDVSGTSKGRGFAGVMKRHNMHGFHATHGTHETFRHGGSIGMSATPAKVWKGKRMAGQYGNSKVKVQNVKVVEILEEENLLVVKGPVPGPTGALVVVSDAVKRRRRPRIVN